MTPRYGAWETSIYMEKNICSFEHVFVNTQEVVNTARPHAVAAGALASQEKSGDHWVFVVVIREEKAT